MIEFRILWKSWFSSIVTTQRCLETSSRAERHNQGAEAFCGIRGAKNLGQVIGRRPSLKVFRFSVILMHSLHIINYTYSPSIGHNFRPKYVCFKLLLMLRWIRIYQLMRFPSGSQQKLCTRELQAWAMNRLKYDWAGWLQVEMVHEDVVRTHKPGTSFGQSLGGTHP